MRYDLHMTRAPYSWSDNAGHHIPEAEWLAVVQADSELRMATPDDDYHMKRMVLWSRKFEGDGGPWFCWDDGNVYSKNPNAAIVTKMRRAA